VPAIVEERMTDGAAKITIDQESLKAALFG